MEDVLTQEKTINGHAVKVRPFRGSLSNRHFVRLQQCFAPPHQIICSGDVWQKFCLDFLAYTFVDGKEIGQEAHFDTVFTGNLMLLFLIIEFVSEVNFGKDFFSQGGNSGNTDQQEPPKTSE